MAKDTGFIKVHRSIINWEWYHDINMHRLFTHLLYRANHKDNKFEGILIKKGQTMVGRIKLAEETGLSQQQVRTCLDKLKSTNEITITSTNRYSMLTLNNWDKYQLNNQQDNQQVTSKQPTDNQQVTTNKNVKNEEECKEVSSSFEDFWKIYPKQRAGSRGKSETAYNKAIEDGRTTEEHLLRVVKLYADSEEVAIGRAKGCVAWFNDDRFNSEYKKKTQKSIMAGTGRF